MTTPVYQPKGAPSPKLMITAAAIISAIALSGTGLIMFSYNSPVWIIILATIGGAYVSFSLIYDFLNAYLAHIHVEEALLVARKHHPADTIRKEDGILEYRDECWSITVNLPGEGIKAIQVSKEVYDQSTDVGEDEVFLKVLRGYFNKTLMRMSA